MKYFKDSEFSCKHCGASKMDPDFVKKLDKLREAYGAPLVVSSGYRCHQHPIEAKKASSGAHTSGCAVDFAVSGSAAHHLLTEALKMGFKGIGVQQKGSGRFIHLDDWPARDSTAIWSY